MKLIAVILFFLCLASAAFTQDSTKPDLRKIIFIVNKTSNDLAIEKLYLHTDKSSYAVGDTLWFKAYLFYGNFLNASGKSGLMYIEIADDSNNVVQRVMAPVYGGIAFGQIVLTEKDIPQGSYILRAYTNWMRNFEENYIFTKHFYVNGSKASEWLINYNARVTKKSENESIQLNLKFNQFDNAPVSLREMRILIKDERRTWFKEEVQTDMYGAVNVKFDLPDQANSKNILLSVQDLLIEQGNRKLIMPVVLNRPENIDLQFMPEGGNLLADVPAHIVFKALNEDGYGADISGVIIDTKGKELAFFSSTHKGVGSFNFLPGAGENYYARISLPGGAYKTYLLPAVQKSGIALKISNEFQSDSCQVEINATPDVLAANNTYFLMGEARGIICYGASFRFKNGVVKYKISKSLFPDGIARFTISGVNNYVLNERIIFIDHGDRLNFELITNKASYKQRDSVEVRIKVSDKNGKPVQGNFSLAITDDGQVKTDSITEGSIITRLLLTTGLKGNIEDPGYYLQPAINLKRWQDLDQLLLAQGWVGYDWKDALKPVKNFEYPAEETFLIKGRVTNMFNKPVANSGVTLLAKKPLLIRDTATNDQGAFIFTNIIPADSSVFFIQSKNKKDKNFNVGIEMDEFKPPLFATSKKRVIPWYVNIDTNRLFLANKQIQLKKEKDRISGIITLEEVIVESKMVIKGSKNLNGPGGADIIIGEGELEKAGKKTLGDLLQERIKGLRLGYTQAGQSYYKIKDMHAHIIIDGTNIMFTYSGGMSPGEHFKQYFDYYDAEDIKGIEVMLTSKYQPSYMFYYYETFDGYWNHAFVEVTTRGGKGPFLKKTVGTYLYKPIPFSLPVKFYSPRYTPASTPDMGDLRSTIFWEPYIVTNKDGEATLSFYTADNPGGYSLVIEGSDMAGNIGIKRTNIIVTK